MKKEEVLNIEPENLTEGECAIFSSDPTLKKRYEQKWRTKGVCD